MSKLFIFSFSNLVLASCVHHDHHHRRHHRIRPNPPHIFRLQILIFFRHDVVQPFAQRLPILILGQNYFSLEIAFIRIRVPLLFLTTFPRTFGGVILEVQVVDL